MGYYVGDIPAQPLVIEPARNEEPLDLAPYAIAEVELYGPDNQPVVTEGFTGTIDADTVIVEWPGTSPFPVAGIYQLRITLRDLDLTVRERVQPVQLVADIEDGWHTLDTARDAWRGAPLYDAWLYEILWAARDQVIAYAPKLADGVVPPPNYRHAQILQARNLWNAGKVDPASGGIGEDSFIMRPYPLDWIIKQILRPKTAVPVIG